MLAVMTFWECVGTVVITGLSGGTAVMLLHWLKEHLDRKARKLSYHAKALLEQADYVCGTARAMNELFRAAQLPIKLYARASQLWRESIESILNVWEANAWILEESEETKPFRQRFRDATEALRNVALLWDAAHQNPQTPRQLYDNGAFILLPPAVDAPQDAARQEARDAWAPAFNVFFKEFQALHNAVQPLVREYTSPPDSRIDQ